MENNEQFNTRITEFIINNRQNEVAIIPFTLSYFMVNIKIKELILYLLMILEDCSLVII